MAIYTGHYKNISINFKFIANRIKPDITNKTLMYMFREYQMYQSTASNSILFKTLNK